MKRIDEHFSVDGQIQPDQVAKLAAQGFTAIVCARPDNEDPGQPSFAEIEREARKHGMKAAHVPVATMPPTPEQIEQFRTAMSSFDGPVFGYCRSGARATALYSAR
ncbi:TIGR01244 family sulfur transferase [Mesorhizobium sp. CAU 1741]|uniref:TIGR01244 family sulfur transferase n=1 Tax=Mesorhizobium sp. CAU 1741 TaxID=3140366 RepID=UPI00325BCEF1